MGFLDNFKSLSNISLPDVWKSLQSKTDLEQLKERSKQETVIIFKHSTSCGISNAKLSSFRESWEAAEIQIPVYYLDLLSFREISNLVAEVFDVTHQSPQVIYIKNVICISHSSHHAINYSTTVE